MGMMDYFADWMICGIEIYSKTTSYDSTTKRTSNTYSSSGVTISGVKYNRSAAERYFSQRFKEDITEILVIDASVSLNISDRLHYGGKVYDIETIIDVAEQGEIKLVALKEFA